MKIFGIFIFLYLIFELSIFKINKLEIKNKKIKKTIKIVQISDYHNNVFINLKKLKQSLDKYNPDLVFLTGDLISRNTKKFDRLEKFLTIFSDYRVYFVEGNHELDNKNKIIYKLLENYNIKDLSRDFEEITIQENKLGIYGNSFGIKNLRSYRLNQTNYNILLSHAPEDFFAMKNKYDLVVSGHKHGGQVRLPIFGQIIDHGFKIFPKYSKGLYDIGTTKLYIDSGLGQTIYLRINDRVSYSELTIEKIDKELT